MHKTMGAFENQNPPLMSPASFKVLLSQGAVATAVAVADVLHDVGSDEPR